MGRKPIVPIPLLALSSCLSLGFGGGEPQNTTIVVPQGAAVTCTNHDGTP